MAEFQEVMKQRERMCKSFDNSCYGCPIKKESQFWRCFMSDNPQKAEEIIMKWAEEHPIKTNADKFKEVFGIECFDSCPYAGTPFCQNRCDDTCEYFDFWNQEHKGEQ